ncbi:MAG: nitrite reductase large subunit NirB [Jatrophihabitantaceae bacterium]
MQPTRTLVVIGNGMVGHRLVQSVVARGLTALWEVEVFAAERHPAYDRIALSSYACGATAEDLALAPTDDPRVRVHLGDPVAAVDRGRRLVRAESGLEVGYDALVFASGSRPFVPPAEGADLPGCSVFRTIDDLAGLVDDAGRAEVGVVVGGGLLGLEAANALQQLGLRTHVVEFAPRLMPVQLDAGAGAVLAREIRGRGLELHLGTAVQAIRQRPRDHEDESSLPDLRVELGDGSALTAQLVVFAAGVRPEDALARDCGLAVGPRGGGLVDRTCRSADRRVWAVGECAAVEGTCYGLVAPGYAMADVVAAQLGGEQASVPDLDSSAKLKMLGVEVASFGDAQATTAGALELVWADHVRGRYKKLVVTADASRILGGILVGDASAFALLRAQWAAGTAVEGDPMGLIAESVAAAGRTELPAAALVCSCNNVCAGTIREAVGAGCRTLPSLKSQTLAGTGCGSCVPTVKTLLTAELRKLGETVSTALCEHFPLTRQELWDRIRVQRIATFAELLERHGSGRGCDICRPAAASILAGARGLHPLDPTTAALQDTNDHLLANLQRDGSYSVVPRVAGGEITPDGLIKIGEVARDFGLYTKITGGQRIDMFGARIEQLPLIWRRLVDAGFESGHAYGKALRTVKSCVGQTWCRFGVQDSVRLAVELELRYRGLRAPHKIKAGVSGCARECAEARSKDFGIIATEQGWNLYVGGNGGFTPRHAQLLAGDLDEATMIRTIDRFLMYYVRSADRLQRTAPWIESLDGGLDHVREVVVDDARGLGSELDADMARHVADYSDEWRDTLADPDKLARFQSFVNAPDTPDPSIVFVPERAQHRPATAAERIGGPLLSIGAP